MMISIQDAVERLIDAQSGRVSIPPLSETYGDFTLEHAYAIQDAVRAELERHGQKSIGWKLGATSPSGQAVMGVREPASGFLRSRQYASGADVRASGFVTLGVEAEIAFRIGTTLVGPDVTLAAARRAVAGAIAALELPDFIFSGKPRVADFVASGVIAHAIVLGDSVVPIADLDLAREEVVFERNGERMGTYTGAEVMGDPLNALVWLANHLATRGLAVERGDIVMAGALTKMLRPNVGDTIRAEFAHLGTVSLSVAP